MPWLLLLRSPLAWVTAALVATALFAAVQHTRLALCKAEFAQFRADTERLGAEAKVRNAQEAARHAQDAQEVLDGLQTRYAALSTRYAILRRSDPGSGGVPGLSSAAQSLSACPGDAQKPDTAARRLAELEGRILAILEVGDKELAKYRQLWELDEKR